MIEGLEAWTAGGVVDPRGGLRFFEWWAGLSPWIRYGVAAAFLLASTLIYFLAGRIWIWGWIVGGVLLLFAGPSDSEKKGYWW
jgi:hypothetical protein